MATLSAGSADLGYVILCLVIILGIIVCCIWCCFVFVCAKKDKKEKRSNRLSPDIEEDIPVTPIRNITHVNQSRDHERYSAIDKKIYKRSKEEFKGVNDYRYQHHQGQGRGGGGISS